MRSFHVVLKVFILLGQIDFGKTFNSSIDEARSEEIFWNNLRTIAHHNFEFRRGRSNFQMGINKFTDLTFEEYSEMFIPKGSSDEPEDEDVEISIEPVEYIYRDSEAEFPEVFDWRDRGAVTKVKDQGTCGSCYAMAGIAAIESQYFIRHQRLVELSEQEVIDCAEAKHRANHCSGGLDYSAIEFVRDNGGVSSAADYPYESRAGKCRLSRRNIQMNIEGYGVVNSHWNLEILKNALFVRGPMLVSMDINNESFMRYSSGIYEEQKCTEDFNHAALLVGYGNEDGKEFWIVKNSFGEKWGENGYIRVKATNDMAACGVHLYPIYPVFKKNLKE